MSIESAGEGVGAWSSRGTDSLHAHWRGNAIGGARCKPLKGSKIHQPIRSRKSAGVGWGRAASGVSIPA